jgi:MFS family permease
LLNLFNPKAFEAFSVRDFRLYWTGNTLSKLGTEMQHIALAWQIYLMTNQPLSLGLVGIVRAGPVLLFSVFGGALADSMSRRKLLLITQSSLLILSTIMAITVLTGIATVELLYLLVFLSATASSADGPAHSAVIPSLVPRNLMTNAITLNNLSWSVAGIIGPAMGGLIIAGFGAGAAFAFDAFSFLAVIIVLLLVKAPLLPPEIPLDQRGIRGNLRRIKQGFSFLARTRIVLTLALLDFFAMLFGASLTLLPVFARDILKVGPEGLGILASAPAVGAVLGAAGLTLVKRPRFPGRIVLFAIGLYAICVIVFGLSTLFWLSWLMLAGTGLADTISMTMRQSIRQLMTPEEYRGRIAGVSYLFAVSGTQLGEFEAGVMAQVIGTQPAVALGGIACLSMVCLISWRSRSIRYFEETHAVDYEPPALRSEVTKKLNV